MSLAVEILKRERDGYAKQMAGKEAVASKAEAEAVEARKGADVLKSAIGELNKAIEILGGKP